MQKLILWVVGEVKVMKMSAKLEDKFKDKMWDLLKEYKDMFDWSYIDLEHANPWFYECRAQIKKDAIHVEK